MKRLHEGKDAAAQQAERAKEAGSDAAHRAEETAQEAKDHAEAPPEENKRAADEAVQSSRFQISSFLPTLPEDLLEEVPETDVCTPFRGTAGEAMASGDAMLGGNVQHDDGMMLLACGVCDAYAEDNDIGDDFEYKTLSDCVDTQLQRFGEYYDVETCGTGFAPEALQECITLAKDKENSYQPLLWADYEMACRAHKVCVSH